MTSRALAWLTACLLIAAPVHADEVMQRAQARGAFVVAAAPSGSQLPQAAEDEAGAAAVARRRRCAGDRRMLSQADLPLAPTMRLGIAKAAGCPMIRPHIHSSIGRDSPL